MRNFTNLPLNLNKNPMTTNFYNPTALALLGVWTPAKWFAMAGGVLDPNTTANTLAADAFNKVNLYLQSIFSYQVGGLPGQFSPAFNWSNRSKIDQGTPFGQLFREQIPQAVGVLLGSPSTKGLPINFRTESWFLIANFSQYFYVKDDPETIIGRLKSGQPLRGIGVFGRMGFAPQVYNPVTRDGSVALFAHGLFNGREYDSFGAGFYYNAFSSKLKFDIEQLTAGTKNVKDEKGIEVFYDFAITPAIRLIPSYQRIWDPLTTQVATNKSQASVFLARVNVAF